MNSNNPADDQTKLTIDMIPLSWQAQEEDAEIRLDVYLAEQLLASHSRSRLQALLKAGCVEVNGVVVHKPALRIQPEDQITLQLPPGMPPQLQAEPIPLVVHYEDDDMLIVEKPAGMLTHPTPKQTQGTLVNALLHHCAGRLSGINGVLRPGIVHRLDKDTSGLLMVAKSDRAHRGLSEQLQPFHPQRASRTYRAIVQGHLLPNEQGQIIAPIGRDPHQREKMRVDPSGRPAETHWQHCQTLMTTPLHLVYAQLLTGRTHQIRVHFASKGWPILGDPLYGSGLAQQRGWHVTRQLLQAFALMVRHPVNETMLEVSIPVDPDFKPYL